MSCFENLFHEIIFESFHQDVLRQNETLKQQLASLSQAVNEKGGNSSSTSVMQLSQQLREMQDRLLATIHEKDALELKHAKLLEEKEQVVKSREELKVKCQSLEIEKERSSMEGSYLNNSLQKVRFSLFMWFYHWFQHAVEVIESEKTMFSFLPDTDVTSLLDN